MRYPYLRILFFFLISAFMCVGVFTQLRFASAEEADALRQKIIDHNKQLAELNEQIKEYQKQLDDVGKDKKTLQSAIQTLDLSRKKIIADIGITENKINAADLTIQELEGEISDKEVHISRDADAIASVLRSMDELESKSYVEVLLSGDSLADAWDTIAALSSFQESVHEQIQSLAAKKKEYESTRSVHSQKKAELTSLKGQLSGQKTVLDDTRKEKDTLLKDTKNKESNYQQMLSEKKKLREQFERELKDYESQLKYVLDKSTIPTIGSSALSWPFEASYMNDCPSYTSVLGNAQCITQYFGNTAFAQSGAYNGKGHNGIDFRAPIGTRIIASLTGTVAATGNTDLYQGCYSFGKWVLVRHNNGLSTLYAHLSSISVSEGQTLTTGATIGYSGATGYATGPHLHFTVYASGGVKVQKLSDIPGRAITGCSPASIPVAAFEAYLNPLDFLPR